MYVCYFCTLLLFMYISIYGHLVHSRMLHLCKGSSVKALSDTWIHKEVGVRADFFSPSCVFGKVCGVLLYVTKPSIFPFLPQSIRLPIWSTLYIPPLWLCVWCEYIIDFAYSLSTIIHFFYFFFYQPGEVKLEHSMSTNITGLFSAVTHKHPLQDCRHHTTQVSWLPVKLHHADGR